MSDNYEVEITYGASAPLRVQAPAADSVAEPEPPGFQRFAELTRKLVQVPKAELDEKRQAT